MDRRDFLKGTSAAALGLGATTLAAAHTAAAADDALALSTPRIVPARRTLRMITTWRDAVTGPGDHVRRFAKRIESATDGRWVIEIANAPVVGVEAFKAVMTGAADIYAGHEHAHRELHPAFSYFAGLPCRTGVGIASLNAWLTAAGGQELWDGLAAEFNMKGLVIGHSGRASGLFSRTPIRSRADLQGKRIATEGVAADVLGAVGAMPVLGLDCTSQDLYAIPDLDGIDVIGPYARPPQSEGWRATTVEKPQWRSAPLNDSGCAYSLGLRRSFWDGLPNSERILLTALAGEALSASRAELKAEAVARMQGARGDQIPERARRTRDAVEYDPLERIAETIVADLAGHDGHAQRINASYMAFKVTRPRPAGV